MLFAKSGPIIVKNLLKMFAISVLLSTLFPSVKDYQDSSIFVVGFISGFRDWCSTQKKYFVKTVFLVFCFSSIQFCARAGAV